MTQRILLVEDEPSLQLTLTDRLRSEGYEVASETDGEEADRRLRTESFDLVVLDWALPGKTGLDLCRDLRQRGDETPVLMLTARTQLTDRVVGLKIGADDYLTKPFETIELLARIEALLRRSRPRGAGAGASTAGRISIDRPGAVVAVDGEVVELSALEYKLLCHFVDHPGVVQSRDLLLDQVWGYEHAVQTRTVDVHVASLRQKIEVNASRPAHIVTVHGRGYKFVPS
ncbi:MAG: response regulator transcription factor [Acidobacteriota bacterium]